MASRAFSLLCLLLLAPAGLALKKAEDPTKRIAEAETAAAEAAIDKLAADSAAVLLEQANFDVSHATKAAAERLQSDVTMVLKKLAGNSMYDFKMDLADIITPMIVNTMMSGKPQLPTDPKAKAALGRLPMDAVKGLQELVHDKTVHVAESDAVAMLKSLVHDASKGKPLDVKAVNKLSSDGKAALQEVAKLLKAAAAKEDKAAKKFHPIGKLARKAKKGGEKKEAQPRAPLVDPANPMIGKHYVGGFEVHGPYPGNTIPWKVDKKGQPKENQEGKKGEEKTEKEKENKRLAEAELKVNPEEKPPVPRTHTVDGFTVVGPPPTTKAKAAKEDPEEEDPEEKPPVPRPHTVDGFPVVGPPPKAKEEDAEEKPPVPRPHTIDGFPVVGPPPKAKEEDVEPPHTVSQEEKMAESAASQKDTKERQKAVEAQIQKIVQELTAKIKALKGKVGKDAERKDLETRLQGQQAKMERLKKDKAALAAREKLLQERQKAAKKKQQELEQKHKVADHEKQKKLAEQTRQKLVAANQKRKEQEEKKRKETVANAAKAKELDEKKKQASAQKIKEEKDKQAKKAQENDHKKEHEDAIERKKKGEQERLNRIAEAKKAREGGK